MKNSAFSRYFSFAEVLVNLIPPSMQKCCALPNQPGLRYSLTRWARSTHPNKKKMIWRGAFSAGFFAEEWILTDQHRSIDRGLITATAVLLCCLLRFLAGGQVTAFFGVFYHVPVLALGVLFSAGRAVGVLRWVDEAWLPAMRNKNADSQKPVRL
jgi:fatty-acid desaturase